MWQSHLGRAVLTSLTGYGGDKGDAFAWRLLVDVLKPICRRAEELGITMNIHNHEATTIEASAKVTLLIEHVGSDALKSLNDITNFYHLGEDIAEVTEKLGPLTAHCHVKGVTGMYPYSTFLIPGEAEDELDFRTFAASLGKVGYDKYISVETFPHMRMEKAADCSRYDGGNIEGVRVTIRGRVEGWKIGRMSLPRFRASTLFSHSFLG